MALKFVVFCLALSWFNQISLGTDHTVIYNEEQLIDSCVHTCSTLPDRTELFGCERIHGCKFNREGWNKGFVRCDWCSCQCTTSDIQPGEPIKIIKDETELFGTCTGTCSASGLQATDKFGCAEVRDCHLQATGSVKGFVRCDYCECDCITKAG